ncbi:major facilitator superfamily domain-containing protein [Microdochium trichocladiopsis]|uniref:Major facilitator superfamily domain-containing protein n=1 Tax=Microdochium trichocladiopsis TaxID=1682393 RepID=A0A9P9BKI0_9PEZI|nr:major facilitator superfamily domain-containing protein [Microdochium trichocladiopsis]KAH7018541.1 major facilitator superfamily domain-containing protein [Microdochium trichocladiopsis]
MADTKTSVSLCDDAEADKQHSYPNKDHSRLPPAVDAALEKRVVRKVDLRLLPMLGALYTIAMIDRSNISVARISGLDDDVGLAQGNRASIALLVFFIGYMLFELPSNMIIHRVGAANWISFIVFSWGLVTIGIGFLNDWISLAVLRAILGAFEAGFYPGCIYLIGSWYRKFEVQKRMAIFFMTGSALSAFANILALGLVQISRVHHYKGWRWIYIIEGALTCLLAVVAWFVVVDFPDSHRNKFLSAEEKQLVLARLAIDRGGVEETREKVTAKIVGQTLADWKVWAFSLMYMAGAVGVYAFLFFLPIILQNGMGFSRELAFILSAPPALFSVIEALAVSWLADKYRLRGPFVIFQGLVGIVGLCMTGFLHSPAPRYVGTFLGQAGVNGLVVTTLAWQSNNLRGDAQRATATAVMVTLSGIGGIYSSLVFRQQDAPNYFPGIMAVMAICIAAVVAASVSILVLRRQNKQADEGKRVIDGMEGYRWTI